MYLCASGCKIVYEGKRDTKNQYRIYRVTNDFNFNPICGAGRFVYDNILPAFEGNDFNIASNAIKNSNVIIVGGNTANNEARFLSLLKQKFEIKLVNDTLKRYKEFISVYYGSGAKSVALNDIANYKLIISIGSSIKK